MQLLHEHTPIVTVKDMNMSLRDVSSHNFDVKERRSSDASLFTMNPVASGDNVAMELNPTQKLKDELPLPPLVPCCEGKELQINEELVHSGLSAISVKHDSVVHCLSMSCACEKMQVPPGLVKNRNSFRSLHRPDLKRVPYLRRLTPDELEALFRGYADCPRTRKSENSKENQTAKTIQDKIEIDVNDGNGGALHPIPETKSGVEDVPVGMRLHGARARLYTSVLAGAKAGDQLDNESTNGMLDNHVPEDIVLEDEIQLHEELQIILPPRNDDITAESSTINSDNISN